MTQTLPNLTFKVGPKISDKEFEELAAFIYERTGIAIPATRKYLVENRLGSRIAALKLGSFGDYAKFLRVGTGKDQEFELLCELVTTNETSFFRDPRQLDVFRDEALAEVIERQKKAGKQEINIWSAGCSSGEEPYTLAIMLHELLRLGIIGWRIRITAVDLSPAVLAKAKDGLYGDYALRNTSPDMLSRYFTKETGGFRVHPKVSKLVTFQRMNLNDRMALKAVPRSQIVFCRNVIIYFDDDMKKRVISSFYDNLVDDGYLVLGHSESIHKISRAFTPIIKPGGIVYRKLSMRQGMGESA